MSVVTLATRHLCGMLDDLALTAADDPELRSLHGVTLHTDVGEYAVDVPSDGGERPLIEAFHTDLLVGTSSDRYVIAQAHAAAEFSSPAGWPRAVMLGLTDVKALSADFAKRVSLFGRKVTHRCEIELASDRLTVREDPRQVPHGLAMTVPAREANPDALAVAKLDQDGSIPVLGPDGGEVSPSIGHGYSADHLMVLAKVGVRRGMPVALYRRHQSRPVVAEVGASYRAVITAYQLDTEVGQHLGPTVRIFGIPEQSRIFDSPTEL